MDITIDIAIDRFQRADDYCIKNDNTQFLQIQKKLILYGYLNQLKNEFRALVINSIY